MDGSCDKYFLGGLLFSISTLFTCANGFEIFMLLCEGEIFFYKVSAYLYENMYKFLK